MKDPIKKRLIEKFAVQPKWAEDFSIEASQEKNVSRRDFIRYLALVSLGLLTGTAGVFVRSLFKPPAGEISGVRIMGLNDLAVGESRSWMIPGKKEPAIIVRLDESRYVGYGQKCTHLQCPVLWSKDQGRLVCPCHNGAFDVGDGHVLYGPPERPLPRLQISVEHDGVYYQGVTSGTMV